ncbi:hypothetical protein [Streptomyces sp. NPDC046939]|uniref:hypothetical protein n=1 Tax=Streptomyces sp. NPDC046939 TaxID=3155376 RepID=UPI0033F093C8
MDVHDFDRPAGIALVVLALLTLPLVLLRGRRKDVPEGAAPERPGLLRRHPRTVRTLLVAVVLGVGAVGWSVSSALTHPGDASTAARLADWAREHHLGAVVDQVKQAKAGALP